MSGPRALFVMPPFSRHAARRNWQDTEEFFNPENFWEQVHLVSLGEGDPEVPGRLGSLRIHPLPDRGRAWRTYRVSRALFRRRDRVTREVADLAREHRVDLVAQRYGGPIKHGIPVLQAALHLGLPALITIQNDYDEQIRSEHGPLFRLRRRFLEGPMWRDLTRLPAVIWTVSDFLSRWVVQRGADPAKVVTISNKDRMERYTALPAPAAVDATLQRLGLEGMYASGPTFLSVGRLIVQKNYPRMLAGFAEAARAHPGIRYVIVGRGPCLDGLQAEIGRLGIEDRVFVVREYLTAEDLHVLYWKAAALLFVSRFEGQGRVALEALACGTPVIASEVGPLPEIVAHGRNGLLVPPDDVGCIATSILEIASGRLQGEEARGACVARARECDLSVINPREAALYEGILRGRTSRKVEPA